MAKHKIFTFIALICFSLCNTYAQQSAYLAYIERYKDMALMQMYKYGVPASITLAQGLLESRAGQSRLATKANNHFGIKVGSTWTGPYILMDDDEANEKFRVYKNAAASYEDHSLFLCNNRRYASLFKLERDNYKQWAKGLKSAGYATNPRYAHLLIDIIERYDLHKYDKIKHKKWEKELLENTRTTTTVGKRGEERAVYRCNDAYYVLAHSGDTYASIARWAGKSERKLRQYNEVPKNASLSYGDVVFLEKKRSKAARQLKNTFHCVKAGDSMHSIAQSYGMQLHTLYKINKLSPDSSIQIGDLIKIR